MLLQHTKCRQTKYTGSLGEKRNQHLENNNYKQQEMSRAHIFITRTDPYQSQKTCNPTRACNSSSILARTWHQ